MYTNEHGGNCCGVTHMVEFAYNPSKQHFTDLETLSADVTSDLIEGWEEGHQNEEGDSVDWGSTEYGHCIEAVLTDQQLEKWAPEMKRQGWKLIFRFHNDNSGNTCNILVKSDKEIPEIPAFW